MDQIRTTIILTPSHPKNQFPILPSPPPSVCYLNDAQCWCQASSRESQGTAQPKLSQCQKDARRTPVKPLPFVGFHEEAKSQKLPPEIKVPLCPHSNWHRDSSVRLCVWGEASAGWGVGVLGYHMLIRWSPSNTSTKRNSSNFKSHTLPTVPQGGQDDKDRPSYLRSAPGKAGSPLCPPQSRGRTRSEPGGNRSQEKGTPGLLGTKVPGVLSSHLVSLNSEKISHQEASCRRLSASHILQEEPPSRDCFSQKKDPNRHPSCRLEDFSTVGGYLMPSFTSSPLGGGGGCLLLSCSSVCPPSKWTPLSLEELHPSQPCLW